MEIDILLEYSNEILDQINHLIPQISNNAKYLSFKDLRDIISSECTNIIIAHENGCIMGCLTLVLFFIPTGKRAWIYDVVVDKKYREKGIGTSLINYANKIAEEYGAKTIELTSRPTRIEANKFYKKLGFKLRNTNVYRYRLSSR